MMTKRESVGNTLRVKFASIVVAWTISFVLIVWSVTASIDSARRLDERTETFVTIRDAIDDHNRSQTSIVSFIRQLAIENNWEIPVDENGVEQWPQPITSIVIIVPER